jgi:hypothetical protein
MPASTTKKFSSLWPLPGGNKRYLDTVDRMLKWIASQEQVTRDDLIQWFRETYNVSVNSIPGYISVVTALGVIEIHDGRVQLTDFGKKVLQASDRQEKARLVTQQFMQRFIGFADVLAFYAQVGGPVHLSQMVEGLKPQFPQWTSIYPYEYRALWLLSLGCLRQVKGREYEITDFGRQMLEEAGHGDKESTASPPPPQQAPSELSTATKSEVEKLIRELEEAATDSAHPQRLETAVARAFQFLGFSVDQWGETGETDVFLQAHVGDQVYRVVVDAKSRHTGKLQDLPITALTEHREKNEADYIVVIAGSFAGGRVLRAAENNGIVLMSVPVLSTWLRLHEQTPLNLDIYRAMFAHPGELKDIPAAIVAAMEERRAWANLVVDLFALIEETYEHGLNQPLASEQIFTMLFTRLRGVRYSRSQITAMLEFLTHPAIRAMIGDPETGVTLAMSQSTLVRVLRSLADLIETTEPETYE